MEVSQVTGVPLFFIHLFKVFQTTKKNASGVPPFEETSIYLLDEPSDVWIARWIARSIALAPQSTFTTTTVTTTSTTTTSTTTTTVRTPQKTQIFDVI